MMKGIALLLLLLNAASSEKYYLGLHHLLYPGVPDIPEYVVSATIESALAFYYDGIELKIRHDWVKELIQKNTVQWAIIFRECWAYKEKLKNDTKNFIQPSSKSGGNVIIQNILGCDWDDETDEVTGQIEYGTNGEDFITFDMKAWNWIAINQNAEPITKEWDGNKDHNKFWKAFLHIECPMILKLFAEYGKAYLSRKVLPSVFLLQKTPSSPVTCHSTGFFPARAIIFWRKDGEEIHEGVGHGDILPNDDGSFQMSVDLEVLSIPPEDWGRYECVFELSGVQNYVVTKLDQDTIRSNNAKKDTTEDEGPLTTTSIAVIATIGCVIVIIIAALASISFKKTHLAHRTERSSTPSSDIALETTSDSVSVTGSDTASNTGSF